jgi:hypothetical protein
MYFFLLLIYLELSVGFLSCRPDVDVSNNGFTIINHPFKLIM